MSSITDESSLVLWQPARSESCGSGGGVASRGEGGQMDEVITRITEHEGGAVDRCHHRANSWRLKPLQQLGDCIHTHKHTCTQTHAHSVEDLPSPVLKRDKWPVLWKSMAQLANYFPLFLQCCALHELNNEHTSFSLSHCSFSHQCCMRMWHPPSPLVFSCVFKLLTSPSHSFILPHEENRDINGAGSPTVWVITLLFP